MTFELLLKLFFLCCLLILSAFFSGSETALFSLSSVRVHRLQEEKKRGASTVAGLLKEPRTVLATILLSNLFVNVFSTSLAEEMASSYFGERGLEICIAVMSLVILIFCEITPKVVAVARAERASLLVAPVLKFFIVLTSPVRILFLKIANIFMRVLVPAEADRPDNLTPDLFLTAVDMGRQEGILSHEESAMLQGIIALKSMTARDRMTPRDKIFALNISSPLADIHEELKKRGLSRVPIYKDDPDHVVGILYSKDLITREILELRAIQIYDLLRPTFFIAASMPLDQLLRTFRSRRLHMALVLDERKLLTGLITLDDLLEVIVGSSIE